MKLTKQKKLLVFLLVIGLVLVLTGCAASTNYEPDPTSTSGAIVGAVLIFFQKMTATIGLPNFCVGIFILTVLVKLVTHPLTVKQQKNVKAMSTVQPKMLEINKKYANNPEKKQEATMKLYKEENINPMASCLPLLIQMPIIMVLFWGMRNFIPPTGLEQYYSFFWISDLRAIVSTTQWPFVLPLLCAITTAVQQLVSMPNLQDKTQRIMLIAMPVMFLFMAQQFPAGLCLYWIFYGIVTAIQTLYINFRLKIGLFASPEDKEKSKELRAANAKNREAAMNKRSSDGKDRKEERQQRQQTHTHTHNPEGEKREGKLPDKPWQ